MINTFIKAIGTGIVGIGLSLSSLLGIHQEAPQANLGAFNVTAGGTYRLNSSVGTTDTSIKLSSFKEPISNTPYTMAYMNTSIAYGTLDPQQPTRSELISFTGITQNSDGTAILTGVTRGLSRSYPYTASSTFRVAHPGQSIFILSDAPQVFNQYTSAGNNSVVTGSWSFPTPTVATNPVTLGYATSTFVDFATNQSISGSKTFSGTTTHSGPSVFSGTTAISNGLASTFNGLVNFVGGFTSGSSTFTSNLNLATNKILNLGTPTDNTDGANKAYVDGVAIAGAPVSNNTTTGIGRTASSTQISTGYSSTTPYFIPSSLASSTASTSPVVVVTNSSGRIDPSFLSGTEAYTFSGTTTLATTSFNGAIQVNGTSSTPIVRTYTTTGTSTWTKPTGLKYIIVKVQGAGGGSGGNKNNTNIYNSPGAGAGGYSEKLFQANELSSSETIFVGTGGTAGAGDFTTSGTNGGNSTFSSTSTITAIGGSSSTGCSASSECRGGSGGAATGGTINITGGDGGDTRLVTANGVTFRGSAGLSLFLNSYGSGGVGISGSSGNSSGTAGKDGIVIVTEYYI